MHSVKLGYLVCAVTVHLLLILFECHGNKDGWMDELGFYVPSTVFQSFRDDGRVNMKGSVQ